ncbi:hypothetical protein GCM10007938_24090 [Vibrio zhanjiangensis]|uniref:Outer membrane protein beta-barrel domain-containing protein n=1 Tax=Vibrio zhanjiangensis TaxID=1046128 RepID=A0ABQ6F087_9VIBR|nr:hypothetical protein [Vibrio zhanjiangensis]GLT18629.1 hypothetical protein GCM10007938_24090 [Vibrio zhanjiangensis]
MKKIILISAFVCSGFVSVVNANNFNYNFFEVRTAINPEMFGAEFSTFFTDNSHFILRADTQFDKDYDFAGGIGFNGPVSQFADVYGQLLVHQTKYTPEYGADKDTTAELNIGLRLWLAEQIEVTGRIGRNDDSSVFYAGVRFHSTDQLTLAAETRNNGLYGPQVTMSVRFHY